MADRMNPTVKTQWLTALRSGEYKQAKTTLHDPHRDSFCCLGVLCDLYRKSVGGSWDEGGDFVDARGERTSAMPSEDVVTWAGSEDVISDFNVGGTEGQIKLSSLNDRGSSFAEIADLIEVYL